MKRSNEPQATGLQMVEIDHHKFATMNEMVIVNNSSDTILVDARLLHQQLQVQIRFNDWILRRIQEYEFLENDDYVVILKNEYLENQSLTLKQKQSLNIKKDYHLTLDTAKELAMLERNEVGKRVRKYFIEVEKQARKAAMQALPAPKPVCGVTPIVWQGMELVCYVDFLRANGRSTRSGSVYKRPKQYPEHFRKVFGRQFHTREYAISMLREWGSARQLSLNLQ